MTGARDSAVSVDRDFGRSSAELGWVPAPRYILRRSVVLEMMGKLPQGGRVLEIGCGAGSLLGDLDAVGFECEAAESSAEARRLAARMLADRPDVRIHESFHEGLYERFDVLLAFEVLEHIEDDVGSLREWMRALRPGGMILVSVPAHSRRWNAADVWAGHVRRYDRADLVSMAERAGARVVSCLNYGFPLANLVEPLRAWTYGRQLRLRGTATEPVPTVSEQAARQARDARTGESGVRRSTEARLYPLLTNPVGRLTMRAACRVQRWFADSERGNGFVLLAEKS